MPLISTKGVYGLAAMYELSHHDGDLPMQIKEISAKASIPQNYLEQLLGKLRIAGLVTSTRGARGGYLLAQEPKDIKVLDILIALEDDLKVIDSKTNNPILDLFFSDSNEKIKTFFDISLSSLEDYKVKYNEFLHFNI